MSTIDLTSFRQVEDRQDGFISYKLRKSWRVFGVSLWYSSSYKIIPQPGKTRKETLKMSIILWVMSHVKRTIG